jgi:hypothetical protein
MNFFLYPALNLILVLFLSVQLSETARGAVGSSVLNGSWADASTWSFGGINRLPTCGDTLTIPAGGSVTVNSQVDYSACGTLMYVIVEGSLLFTNGNKLQLPCNSTVQVMTGGVIRKTTAGGGNSTFIEICEIIEWSAGDGDLHGPVTLGGNELPVTLLYFYAKRVSQNIELNWSTASEINNDYFTVEKSTDGINFLPLSNVPGSGNSTILRHYEFADDSPYFGTSYYRLRQTDYDGTFSFSPVVAVKFIGDEPLEFVTVSSDGVSVNLYVALGNKNDLSVSISDSKGLLIKQKKVNLPEGKSVYRIDMSGLSRGIYIVTINCEDKISSKRFLY